MSDDDNDDGFEDIIGYARPPLWTQFKKGVSGNPKGRPKKAKPEPEKMPGSALDDIRRAELSRQVQIVEAGKPVKLSLAELTVKAQLSAAVKGNPIAQRDVLREAQALEQRDAIRATEAAIEQSETYRRMAAWRRKLVNEWAAAKSDEATSEERWPHPDDFFLFPDSEEWRIRGPISADDLSHALRIKRCRNAVFARHVAALKRKQAGLAELYAVICFLFEDMLPKRWWWMRAGLPRADVSRYFAMTPEELDRFADEVLTHPPFEISAAGRREVYQQTNAIMKPILKQHGYRTLRQFENACADYGANTPYG